MSTAVAEKTAIKDLTLPRPVASTRKTMQRTERHVLLNAVPGVPGFYRLTTSLKADDGTEILSLSSTKLAEFLKYGAIKAVPRILPRELGYLIIASEFYRIEEQAELLEDEWNGLILLPVNDEITVLTYKHVDNGKGGKKWSYQSHCPLSNYSKSVDNDDDDTLESN